MILTSSLLLSTMTVDDDKAGNDAASPGGATALMDLFQTETNGNDTIDGVVSSKTDATDQQNNSDESTAIETMPAFDNVTAANKVTSQRLLDHPPRDDRWTNTSSITSQGVAEDKQSVAAVAGDDDDMTAPLLQTFSRRPVPQGDKDHDGKLKEYNNSATPLSSLFTTSEELSPLRGCDGFDAAQSPFSAEEHDASPIEHGTTATRRCASKANQITGSLSAFRRKHLTFSNLLGASIFLLYHVVFCLSMGSTIQRPHSSISILGIMTKTVALGIMFGSPVYILSLSPEIPAIYPTVDLFLAPFMSQLSDKVDHYLNAHGVKDNEVFFASFAMLSGIGLLTAGIMVVLASRFKLANLGSYLPYPVLCGFFGAVGVSMWALAFSVDTGGQGILRLLKSGDWRAVGTAALHHSPSFLLALTMKYLGTKNPLSVSSLVLLTVAVFYTIMGITGTSRAEAIKTGWFWSPEELVVPHMTDKVRVYGGNADRCFQPWPSLPFFLLCSAYIADPVFGVFLLLTG